MSDKFWMVLRQSGNTAPSKRHASLLEAKHEAARLSQQEREPYYVLEVIGIIDCPKPYSWTPITVPMK